MISCHFEKLQLFKIEFFAALGLAMNIVTYMQFPFTHNFLKGKTRS